MLDVQRKFMMLMFELCFPNPMVTKSKREAAKNPQKEQYPKFVLHIFGSRPENKERAKING
jgi:hypothetical protein